MKNVPRKIVVDIDEDGDIDDVTYFFGDSTEPMSSSEFVYSSPTRRGIEVLERAIQFGLDNLVSLLHGAELRKMLAATDRKTEE